MAIRQRSDRLSDFLAQRLRMRPMDTETVENNDTIAARSGPRAR
jgi:hypothetical protein